MTSPSDADLPPAVLSYIARFDAELSASELDSDHFAYRMQVIEFLRPDSELAQAVNRDYVALKEVERRKFLPSHVVEVMKEAGYGRFNMHSHTVLWQQMDAKDPSKGFGTNVEGYWYWYESWVALVLQHCEEHSDLYR